MMLRSLLLLTLLMLLQSSSFPQLLAAAPATHPLSPAAPSLRSSRPARSSLPQPERASSPPANRLSELPELQTVECGRDVGNQSFTVSCGMSGAVTLTLRGQSFGVLSSWGEVDVRLSSQSHRLPGINSDNVRLLSDTALTMPSLWLLNAGLLPQHYAGQPLQLSFAHGEQRSNAINVSFTAPAAPTVFLITRLSAPQAACALPTDGFHVDHCVAGVSGLAVFGQNFWPSLRLRVQGQDCTILLSADNRIDFLLPIVPDYQAGSGYDLMVIAAHDVWPGLNRTLPAAVAFNPPPILLGALACIDTGHNIDSVVPQLKCGQGARMTFLGYGLPLDGPVTVRLTWAGSRSNNSNYSCVDPVVVNSSALTCTLPPLPAAALASAAGKVVGTSLVFNTSDGILRSNRFRSVLWDELDAPFISAVSGCGVTNSAALQLPLCMPGDSLTLQGGNFIGNSSGGLYIVQDAQGRFMTITTQPAGAQPAQLVVIVPQLNEFIRYNRTFTLSVQQSWRRGWSNTFTLHMATHPPWGRSSSTGQGGGGEESEAEAVLSQGAIAAVVVGGLLVVILSVAAALRWRGLYCFKVEKPEEEEPPQAELDVQEPGHPDYDPCPS